MHLSDSEVLVKALHATGSPVTITDARSDDNIIIYCNDAFMRLSGYGREEIIGRNCRFLQGEDTDHREVAKISQALKAKKPLNVTLLNYTKDGRPFWNDLQVSPVFDDNNKLTHFIGFQNDITERLERERLALLTQKLENEIELMAMEREKLTKINDVKDDFISIASHQLRTPVTAVKQYLDILNSDMIGALNEKQQNALEAARRNNDRQLNIIEDLLKVAKIDSQKVVLKKRTTNMNILVQDVVNDFHNRAQAANVTLKAELGDHSIHLLVDAHLIRTAFDNLVDNAINYSKPGTIVTIGAEQENDTVVVRVADTGIGIPKQDIPKIFDKFTRTSSAEVKNSGGSGLGLYWVKSVVELHDATISVESAKGVGSTFTITFAAS